MNQINWQFCKDPNEINDVLSKGGDYNWEGFTDVSQIINILYHPEHRCYMVFWVNKDVLRNKNRAITDHRDHYIKDLEKYICDDYTTPDQWIPVSKKLPREGDIVLASWSKLWDGAIVLARRSKGRWSWAFEHGSDFWDFPPELCTPEAWMPIPKPYCRADMKGDNHDAD